MSSINKEKLVDKNYDIKVSRYFDYLWVRKILRELFKENKITTHEYINFVHNLIGLK